MKIAIGMKTTKSSFGGGNQFGNVILEYLESHGHQVYDDLNQPDLDVILMTEPRTYLSSCSFGPLEIEKYLRKVNPNAKVVHRINECDERKGTKTVNKQLELANTVVDHTVYIASWLIDLFQGFSFSPDYSVILNGTDRRIFKFSKKEVPPMGEKFKIVTHHWSPHLLKGWDRYKELDQALDQLNNFEFHYIGNHPTDYESKNIIFHEPCSGEELAKKLSDCHIYLSASINEPAGMHHIEGAAVGLPLVYRKSGALPEYCGEFGEEFETFEELLEALEKVKNNYQVYAEKMKSYPNSADRMAQSYLKLFEKIAKKEAPGYRPSLFKAFTLNAKYFWYRILNRLGHH